MSLGAAVEVRLGDLVLAVELAVAAGEVVALVGPNGAGKTSLLRALAGLQPLAAGSVELDGTVLEDPATGLRVLPADRRIGLLFQDDLLFPHLSVVDNVAFGPRSAGASGSRARAQARAWLERVGLGDLAAARPGALSGGQARRVALARALATEPRCLLLDEPLVSLDVDARHAVRSELHGHLDAFAGPVVLVTHDAVEAATLADRLVVLEDGHVVQTGTIADVTAHPRSAWAARLAGVNLLRGVAGTDASIRVGDATLVAAEAPPGEVFAAIPPTAVALYRRPPEGSPRNAWRVQVGSLDRYGDRVRVQLTGPFGLVAEVTPAAAAELSLAGSGELWAVVKATEVTAYPV